MPRVSYGEETDSLPPTLSKAQGKSVLVKSLCTYKGCKIKEGSGKKKQKQKHGKPNHKENQKFTCSILFLFFCPLLRKQTIICLARENIPASLGTCAQAVSNTYLQLAGISSSGALNPDSSLPARPSAFSSPGTGWTSPPNTK